MCARRIVGARQEHRAVPHAQRPAHVARIPAARAASPHGLDAAAAAHHRGQSYIQGRERRRGAVQDSRLPRTPPLRTGHGRARPVQSAERAGLRSAPNAHRRGAREARHQHHPGSIRHQYRAHDPPGIRAPGRGAARIDQLHRNPHHSLPRHRSAARHQRDLRHARGRRCDRQCRRMHGQDPAGGRSVGAHFRRPARGAHSRFQHGRIGDRRGEDSRRRSRHRAARRPRLIRGFRLSRRRADQAARTIRWRTRWRPRRSPARRPRTAAATASRCSRIRIRASSGGIPTFW